MPWSTPTLKDVRSLVRDNVRGALPGADALVPNSVLRVMSDVQAGLCHLTLQYEDWLALQLMPDTAETEWLDRHAAIWLTNADGTVGRKQATLAAGTATFTGVTGTIVPAYTTLTGNAGTGQSVSYETTAQITIAQDPTPATIRALDAGAMGNLLTGSELTVDLPPQGVDGSAIVGLLEGGTDTETDDELRVRLLLRIREPPMGGAASDYVQWALAVPGVTRAWVFPQEQGIGTVTVRFMMDDLRADNAGFPLPDDVLAVQTYINTMRPVTVKQCYVLAPLPYPCDVNIKAMNPDVPSVNASVEASLLAMFLVNANPGQTIFAVWKAAAVQNSPGVVSFDLINWTDDVMPAPGYLGTLGDITYTP